MFGLQVVAALAFWLFASVISGTEGRHAPPAICPKIFILSMFQPEADVWYGIPDFDLLAHNITVPGFSPLYPDAHCTEDGSVCQLTTGEAEINAASTLSALVASPRFNLTSTYFLVAGIAGANPARATIGGVSFARYAVQVALEYEVDIRELPSNFTTGYWGLGTDGPGQYPADIYGSEAFELNLALRDRAVALAQSANLTDNAESAAYRALYGAAPNGTFEPATRSPFVAGCDVATSDVFYSGNLLGNSFDAYSKLITNGSAEYCATAQEDNASLEALLRGAKAGKVDFGRIIVMRSLSNFDRPHPGETAIQHLLFDTSGGFEPSLANLYNAGILVIKGILSSWDSDFGAGIPAENYIGDIFGTLGGTPDYGPGAAVIAGFFKRNTKEQLWRKMQGAR